MKSDDYDYRAERDAWKARALTAERETARLNELLRYAREAIDAEYQRANAATERRSRK